MFEFIFGVDPPCLDSKSECTTPRCLALPMQQFQVSTFNFKWTRNNFGMRACRPFRSRPSHRGLKRGVPRSCAASLLLLAAWLGGCAAADVLTPPPAPPPAPPHEKRPVRCGRPGQCSGETDGLRDTNERHAVRALAQRTPTRASAL